VGDIKALIFDEVLLYHFPEKKREYERKKALFDAQRQEGIRVERKESESEESEAS
jgi:hypothetical protein